jgi:hypothetical protein
MAAGANLALGLISQAVESTKKTALILKGFFVA